MDHVGPTLPPSSQQALRHFNMVEIGITSLLEVFCFSCSSAPIKPIKKAYRQLAALVHPDRCQSDPRGATRSMMTLSRAMEIVRNELQYQKACGIIIEDKEFVLHSSAMYRLAETKSEKFLRAHDRKLEQKRSRKNDEERNSRTARNDEEQEARESRERAERERAEQEARESRERAERERAEQETRESCERAEREAKESQDRERAEREAKESQKRAEREAKEFRERADRERAERKRAERKRAERERAERERAEREAKESQERAERERAERELKESQERADRERAEREARESRERADRERAEREAKESQERADRERAEREAKESREQADRERAKRERADRERSQRIESQRAERKRAQSLESERVRRDRSERDNSERVEEESDRTDCDSAGEGKEDGVGCGTGADEDCFERDPDYRLADYIVYDGNEEGDKGYTADMRGDVERSGDLEGEGCRAESTYPNAPETLQRFQRASIKMRRTKQKRDSKRRTMERAKLALQAESVGAMTWKPRRCVEVVLSVGMALQFRWQCEQLIRAYTAYIGVLQGVSISQTWEKVRMKCRNKHCSAFITFNWQPSNGLWKMNKFVPHCDECSADEMGSTGAGSQKKSYCYPAYTPLQISRAVLSEAASDPNISARKIGSLVRAKQIYRRQPPESHYRSVRLEIVRHMNASRAVDMAALEGYAELLRKCEHTVRVFIINGVEMKEQRVKAAQNIFAQSKKAKRIPADAVFDKDVIDLSDISDNEMYYGGLLFVPSVAASYCQYGRNTAAAYAAQYDGVGPQSYGTTFEVVTFDTNLHPLPLLFAHFVGPENHSTWKRVFEECKRIPGFDIPARTTIVEQEESITRAYKEVFENAKMFLDPLHVKEMMGAKLGAAKAVGLSLYERALHAPTRTGADEIVRQYTDTQKAFLNKFDLCELYKAYSNLEDTVVTRKGGESQTCTSLRNHIRSVEPQKMLQKVITIQRAEFHSRKSASEAWKNPVPPNIEEKIATLICHSRSYQETVKFRDGAAGLEATVCSLTDGAVQRRVRLPVEKQTPPICCDYSNNGDGLPCFHGVAVLCKKYGAANIHQFVAPRHLSENWNATYNSRFSVPTSAEVETVISKAKSLVLSGENRNIPKAVAPPRGLSVKTAGVRRRMWYERVSTAKKPRNQTCSLCHQENHTSSECQLRHLFGDSP